MNKPNTISSFTTIVFFVVLMIIGASLLPLLNIQLFPSVALPQATINFYWSNASARVIEQEVTSPLEARLGQVKGIATISSVTSRGAGTITLEFKKGIDVEAVRFELSALIRQLFPQLPDGVSYPSIQMRNTDNQQRGPVLTYTLLANASPNFIQTYAEGHLSGKLASVQGINRVDVYGGIPYEWVVTLNNNLIVQLGISPDEIKLALMHHFGDFVLGMVMDEELAGSSEKGYQAKLALNKSDSLSLTNIAVGKIADRIIFLHDIASVRYVQQTPWYYFRINGQNTVNIVLYPENQVNSLTVARNARKKMEDLVLALPPGYSVRLTYDATVFINKELRKIVTRSLFSIGILLVFVILATRKWRYVAMILLSMLANLLIAAIFYWYFNIEIHLYALAGLTVSLGMLIDNSIIMIDHLRYRGNRKVFLAILAATLTTIGALSVIFFLKEQQRTNLIDFSLVIICNLSVSLLVSLFFIPSLFEKLPISILRNHNLSRKRRIIRINSFYLRVLRFNMRYRWIFILAYILGFGLPIHWLPAKLIGTGFGYTLYNKTLGSECFTLKAKPLLEKSVGGTLRLFTKNVYERAFYVEPGRTELNIWASMPEGCTIQQMNEALKWIETYLGDYKEIDIYQTNIYNASNAYVKILFKEGHDHSGFPHYLKEVLTTKAIQYGGVEWSIYGVGRGFSNILYQGWKGNRIILEGYQYDQLYRFAQRLSDKLGQNPRVRELEISGSDNWHRQILHEYFLDFDRRQFILNDITLSSYFTYLNRLLFRDEMPPVYIQKELAKLRLIASNALNIDLWNLLQMPVSLHGRELKLGSLANVSKQQTGNSIYKNNQQYRLIVAYNFLGPDQLAVAIRDRHISEMEKTLPIGYKIQKPYYRGRWDKTDNTQYLLLLLVVTIIFFTCSILLESLRQPLAVLGMIPISFIGVFLTFYLFNINFDQGGFASLILICGLVVNAGLYLLNDYNQLLKNTSKPPLMCYINAFNHKITPILLTLLSTILGLIPFIWAGKNEIFWYSFASGAIGGLIFSLIALIIYLPFMLYFKKQKNGY